MTICCISDTHGKHDKLKLPEADVLIHTGDLTGHGYEYELQVFLKWFSEVSGFKHKVFIAGNHDWICFDNPQKVKDMVPENIHYLFDSSVELDGMMFYGTPWQPVFLDWAFNLAEPLLQTKWDLIPKNTDVLLTHCPPYGVLDMNLYGTHCGSASLLKKINEIDLILSAFGHIHEAYGEISLYNNITFVNGSTLNRRYEVANDPIIIHAVK